MNSVVHSFTPFGLLPGGQGQDIGLLDLGAPEQHLLQDLVLQQPHGGPPLVDVPPLLDRVGHIPVPPAVVLQSAMPAHSIDAIRI